MSITRNVATRHRPLIAMTRRGAFEPSGIVHGAILSTSLLITRMWNKALVTAEKRAKFELK